MGDDSIFSTFADFLKNFPLQVGLCSPYSRAHDSSRYQLFECQHYFLAGDLCFRVSVYDPSGLDATSEARRPWCCIWS